ncbi:type 1 glutamine amidotransferase [Propionibacterium cyclohexanicum]|uniref:type 1 glutamine amidotransferase n=1 Tax=Propionibacterium cyclohexanicum TaxID=64702 RepID=UPI0015A5051A|nr:glutamine amidotransferase [Propionibacterium cyclohexanicum]
MSHNPVRIVVVYQSLLGIYGDRGNAMVLTQRLRRRGIDAELVMVEPGSPVPTDGAVYLLGGGEDLAQVAAVNAMRADGGIFHALEDGAVLFAVCAGYQIAGNTFTVGDHDEVIEGLGLVDATTRRGPVRAVGEVLSHWTRPDGLEVVLSGFENHGGYTTLGPAARPLARIELGVGNCGDGTEGAVQGQVVCTYPHGPNLVRNPALADWLLEKALGRTLGELPDEQLNEELRVLREQRITVARHSKNLAEDTRWLGARR